MRWFPLGGLLLVFLVGCAGPDSTPTVASFTCRTGLVGPTPSLAGKGRPASPSSLATVFGSLDSRSRVEVRETNCGLSTVSLRYVKPRRMRFVAWLNRGTNRHPAASREPRETQIGDRLGYIRHMYAAPWVGVGVTAHRLLLPDAWRCITGTQASPTFYLLSPPQPPVRDLTVRVLDEGKERIFVEQWRGLLYQCPAGVSCPAPNLDPRFFARFTAVLRVDPSSGLPVSLTTVAQARGAAHRRFVWVRPVLLSQTVFRYGGHFSISLVKD